MVEVRWPGGCLSPAEQLCENRMAGEFQAQPVQIVRDCRVGLGFRYGFGPEVADADAEGLGE
jgi:hypothetical protein